MKQKKGKKKKELKYSPLHDEPNPVSSLPLTSNSTTLVPTTLKRPGSILPISKGKRPSKHPPVLFDAARQKFSEFVRSSIHSFFQPYIPSIPGDFRILLLCAFLTGSLQLFFSPKTRKLGVKGTVILFNIVLFFSATASLTSLLTLWNRKRRQAITNTTTAARLGPTVASDGSGRKDGSEKGAVVEHLLSRNKIIIGVASLGTLILWLSWLLRIDLKQDLTKSLLLRFQVFLQSQKK